MNLNDQLLFFFSALGAFNGLLSCIYLFFFLKPKRLANYLLGTLLLMLSLRIGKSVLLFFDRDLPKIYLQIGLSACFFIGPTLYFYIKTLMEGEEKISQVWKKHFGVFTFIILTIGIVFPYQMRPDLWNSYIINFIYLQWVIYVFLAGFLIKDILQKAITQPRKLGLEETWIFLIYSGNLLICSAYVSAIFGLSYYIMGSISFSIMFYSMCFFLLFRKNRNAIFFDPPSKYGNKKIEEEEAKALLEQLKEVMKKKELYKNPYLKLNDVAKELNILSHRLSQLLNDNLGKSFSLFINEYRVEAAKQLLMDKENYTMDAIGDEVGFSSKSSFYATFKKLTDTTPTGFKKRTLAE